MTQEIFVSFTTTTFNAYKRYFKKQEKYSVFKGSLNFNK